MFTFKNLKSGCFISEKEKPEKRQCTIQPNRKDEDTQEAHLLEAALGKRPRGRKNNGAGKSQGWAGADYLNFPRVRHSVTRILAGQGCGSGTPTTAVGTTFWFSGSDLTLFLGLILHVHVFASSKITNNLGAGPVLCLAVS